jgi:type IV secretory pathway TraG/TraD family ATPase VirD4
MRTLRPKTVPMGSVAPWLIVGGVGGAYALGFLAWLAARIAAVLSGHPWATGPAFGTGFIGGLLRGRVGQMLPGVPAWLIATVFTVLLAAAIALVVVGWRLIARRLPPPDDPLASLASPEQVAPLTPPVIADRARRLRPSLAGLPRDSLPPEETGVLLGTLQPRGPELRGSWEDVMVAIMAPRSFKSTALAIPTVLAAPGPVVATSNKADLWAATVALRTDGARQAWVFDPQSIVFADQDWWWPALDGVTTVEEAERLAGHFILNVDDPQRRDIWGPGATELLSALLLAAGISDKSLTEVYLWLVDDGSPEPVDILESRPQFSAQAKGLRGIQNTAPETKQGLYVTARIGARCLRDPQIMKWVTPPPPGTLATFDPRKFVQSRDTLYLLSKDGGGSAAPLIAALADRVMREAVRRAETRGGRLDPPMPVVLDEAANICRIADLPTLYSHLGSRGVLPITILQSWAQGETVWGRAGMEALWGAATIKLIGSGIDDDRLGERLSRLVGPHDVAVTSYSRGGRDRTLSESVTLRQQPILGAHRVRELRKGTALLLATGCRAAQIALRPWFDGPQADRIRAAEAAALKNLTARAERDLSG